jgi:protein SCO1/2
MFRQLARPGSPLRLAALSVCVLLLAFAGVMIATRQHHGAGPSSIGGPFALVNQDERPVTQADYAGQPFLVFFGYTHCPDVCPTTLADMSQMLNALGKTEKVAALFVTVDPERDTPAVLKDFLSSFDPRIVGLTGDPAAVAAAEKAYRVYAKKVPTQGGDYSMDHTAVVYLMDKDGRFVNALNLQQAPSAAADEFRRDLQS